LAGIIAAAKSQPGSKEALDANLGIITLYKNGFKLGNGEFRDKKEPQNAKFIKELQKGYVPPELEREARREWGDRESIRVQLVDKTTEDFVPPKPKFSFKDTEGQSLGVSDTTATTALSFASAIPKEYKATEDSKKTTIQIVLQNRKKVPSTFNETATVFDIYQHVMFLSQIKTFALYVGMPPKPLSDPNQTILGAKLAGSSIQQRTS